MTSGGNNFNNFPENQLTKFGMVDSKSWGWGTYYNRLISSIHFVYYIFNILWHHMFCNL